MLFIHLGLPKTSSTNLQKNFFPNLKNIEYLGRNYTKENSKFFNELTTYIEFREKFNKKRLEKLKRIILIKCKNKKTLLSNENWIVPYQKNNKTNKIEIISQFRKLKRLKDLLDDTNIEYKFFIVFDKNSKFILRSLESLFATLEERIYQLFGVKNLNFNYFVESFLTKKKNHESIKLFFDIYKIKKLNKIIPQNKMKVFSYNILKKNPSKFKIELSKYFKIKINNKLIDKLKINTRVSEKIDNKYIIMQPSNIELVLKKIIPNQIRGVIKKMIKFQIPKNIKKIENLELKYSKLLINYYKK